MAEIKNLEKLIQKLRAKAAAAIKDSDLSVSVGYSAKYSLWVHENMEARNVGQSVPRPSGLGVYWGPSQHGPKFLEGPAREMSEVLAAIVRDSMRSGKTLAQSLLLAGLKLQAESQKRVPVEYGFLRASAFTRLEKVK